MPCVAAPTVLVSATIPMVLEAAPISSSNSKLACTVYNEYRLLNLRVGSTFADGKYDAVIWVNNLLDQTYYTSTALASLPGASSFGITGQPGNPRLIGATFRANL